MPRRAQRAAALLFVLWICISVASAATNAPPAIWGRPATFAPRDVLYVFAPRAADADGDRLTFSIRNKPWWMWFDTRTGTLKGRPKWAQRGRTFDEIVIRVSDGRTSRALPAFAITVGTRTWHSGNVAPAISGSPPPRVAAGQRYFFRPAARDADGDRLTFSVLNKPEWAQFSSSTGVLQGTPSVADIRIFTNVTIRVSDGRTMTTLPPFDLAVNRPGPSAHSVTLHWSVPRQNTDGTALTDLAGYRVSYGTASGLYTRTIDIPGPGIQSVELQNLASGTWYFAIRSVTRAGLASDLSAEVRAVLR